MAENLGVETKTIPVLPYATMEAPLASLTPRPGNTPQPGQNDPPKGEPEYVDGSGPLFSMYLKLAGEQDKDLAESWKGDADGILTFVSRHSTCAISTQIEPELEDWFILCRCRNISCGIRPGPQAKYPGHVSILPRKHL